MSSNQTWSTKWITCKTYQLNSNYTHCFVNANSHTSNCKATTTKHIVYDCLTLKQKFKLPNPGNYADQVRGNKNFDIKKKNKNCSYMAVTGFSLYTCSQTLLS